MNRLSKKDVLLKELVSIKNAVKQASLDINKSVLSVLRDKLKPLSSSNEATSSKWVACEKCSNWLCIPCIISYH